MSVVVAKDCCCGRKATCESDASVDRPNSQGVTFCLGPQGIPRFYRVAFVPHVFAHNFDLGGLGGIMKD